MNPNIAQLIANGLSLPNQDLSGHSGSLAHSITLVDSEVKTIRNMPDAPDDLPNAEQVNQSIANYKETVAGWDTVRNKLINTLTLISGLAKSAKFIDGIPDFLLTVDSLKVGMAALLQTADFLNQQIKGALTDIQNFENTVDASYRNNASALQASSDEIRRQEQRLENETNDLKAKVDDLDSAKSIVLGIVTVGIYTAKSIDDIYNQLEKCKDEQEKLRYYEQLFDQANLMILSCKGAINTTSIALAGISTVVQQYVNDFKDMHSSDSTSLVVMKAYLRTIMHESIKAGEAISTALN